MEQYVECVALPTILVQGLWKIAFAISRAVFEVAIWKSDILVEISAVLRHFVDQKSMAWTSCRTGELRKSAE